MSEGHFLNSLLASGDLNKSVIDKMQDIFNSMFRTFPSRSRFLHALNCSGSEQQAANRLAANCIFLKKKALPPSFLLALMVKLFIGHCSPVPA